ncbi:putative transcriptional regulator, RpiR family [Olsenella uli DSM 7084]|uniref:Putative transcriptional regulator, RpiR family n=1 Tax=Olsenella uli (strain ATCC 49627 / DSM 7084 / CCUG 31166 / CIP 109912 / JCM 12494 / LMG 11480 / NCIMB 702895 / VPI D76D-27C) TaxID=633147 RepID=E1QYK7_OLSUV|nr:RpiR family transcriptional regulator [Olsenella uli]ADK67471.1 putative transcriptional regulator, RpiR family [Olsenella uli DSM 7084]
MSEIGFDITPKSTLTEGERAALRQHYLTYVRAERDEGRQLRADLGEIYAIIDKLADGLDMADLISRMGESSHIVIFATESSVLALREFQQAMLSEGKVVRLVSENSTEVNGIRALGPSDLLIVVTTSNGFARRQRELIGRSGAQKVVLTASRDDELHALFGDVLRIGDGAEEGGALHRIYATFGVTYFFDRLFTQYARAYDPTLR